MRQRVEDRVRRKGREFQKSKSGSVLAFKVSFRDFNPLDSHIWFELYGSPSDRDVDLLGSVIQSWYIMGRLGGFNSSNLQLANSSMQYDPLYDAEKGFKVMPSSFHDMGDVEFQDNWGRFWVDLGTSDFFSIDVLLNCLTVLSSEYLGIQQVVFGGRKLGDWEEGMTSSEYGYSPVEMASLISQNTGPKNWSDKVKPSVTDTLKQSQDGKGRKRKKEPNEGNNELEIEQQREMKKLENSLFGSLYSPVEFSKHEDEEVGSQVDDTAALFIVDRSANSGLSVYEEDQDLADESSDEKETVQRKPVWVDDEEEKVTVNIAKVNRLRKLRKEEDESVISGSAYESRLRAQHAKLNPGTEWANLDSRGINSGSDSEDSDVEDSNATAAAVSDILRTAEDVVVKDGSKLLPGILEYSRLVDANLEEPSSGPINSVQFHRNAQLLLAAGLDRRLRFFQIDGKRNTKIESIFLEDCPIRKASFLPDGSSVIAAGRRKFFYSVDLVKAKVDKIGPLTGREEKSLEAFEVSPDSKSIAFLGNEGYILLVSSKTRELIGTLKMNGTVRSIAFTSDGNQLLSSGGDGQIYHWDLRTRTCFHKGVDEGCITGTSLCTSPIGNLFAAGSDSGIVNVYNGNDFLGGKRKPAKVIENLTTKVDFIKFNHDAKILAIGSSMKKNSLKLIHLPTFTVFSNWPPSNKSLHYPRCLDFSPHGGFMAMGNAGGKVLLYKLHHYHQS
ncbi:OLC1v1018806C2 [Oldenlandia corymbosa var. corymbosa]|nr:OLC1v1018806C2 [Oldenlandia corymbosa var. corymbosa]